MPILKPPTHNEVTIKDSFNFAKEATTYVSSLYMASLEVESLFSNIPLKIFIMENLAKETFSNF